MLLKRNDILFVLTLVMIISLFISRAALSVAMGLFILFAFATNPPVNTVRNFVQSKVLWGMSLLFLIPLLSGIWSSDIGNWLDALRIKLPLLLLPFAFATGFQFSNTQWRMITIGLGLLVFSGTLWTIINYLGAPQRFEEGYLRSNTLPTPLENDHVRFSWLSAFCIFLFGWLFTIEKRKFARVVWALLIAWMVIFLHILAARTGLIVLYLFSLGLVIKFIIRKKSFVVNAVMIVIIVVLPIIAYVVFPTFRNRVKFISYDYGYFKEGNYLPGGNDAIRVISYKAGMKIIADNPGCGHGFGDIQKSVSQWYEKNSPEVKIEDRIWPSSQFLIYGMGAGIIGIFALIFSIAVLFFTRLQDKFTWCVLLFVVTFPLLYDVGLEIQYGVFLYATILLFLWKWFTRLEQKK